MAGRDFSLDNLNLKAIVQTSQLDGGNTNAVTGKQGAIFEGSTFELGKGVTIEGMNPEDLGKLLKKAGLPTDNLQDAKLIKLDNGAIAIAVNLKPNNGNTTYLVFDKGEGTLVEHSTTSKKGITTTTAYDGDDVKFIQIRQNGQTITADKLSRILKRESKEGTVEYTYGDETVIPAKIIEKLFNGTVITRQNGEKVTTTPDGKTTTETDNQTRRKEEVEQNDSTNSTQTPKPIDISKLRDITKIKIPQKKREPKEIAKLLKKLFFASSSSPNRSQNLKRALAMIDSSNVDWVIYEYKVLTKRDLFADLKSVFKNDPQTLKAYNKHFTQIQYGKYGIKQTFKKQNSVVSNKHHKGDPYSVIREGTIITVKNKKTGKTRQIDLDVLLKNYPDAKDRARMINQLQQLPGEVLMDIAIETDSFIPMKTGDVVNVDGGASCSAAGFYRSSNDTVHLDQYGGTDTLVHEMGHAVDYCGKSNKSSVASSKKFVRIFNEEMRKFVAAGNRRFVYGDEKRDPSAYATANEREMFAECYTLLMTGKCKSKNVIEKYFPKCLEYINKQIELNRNQRDSYRH
ncbi:MAG: hypothetical protein NC191_06685 [Muribaculaceae bacterium]|nr:hypothetical protein [Muribaculaceae bacterium]